MSENEVYEFKLGMFLSELHQPFEESLDTAKRLGAQFVWCSSYQDDRRIFELSDREVDKAVAAVYERGLKFLFMDGGGLFKQVHLAELESGKMLEHAQFNDHFKSLSKVMEVSSRVGVGAVACSSFAWPEEYTAGKPTWPMRWATRGGVIADVDMEKLVEAFSMLLEQAEKYDVDLVLQMMMWNYTNTSANFRRIAEAIGSSRFKAMWCPADNFNCGEKDNATAGFRNLRPYLHGIHAKDLRTNDGSKLDFDYTAIGEGHVDYASILRNLRDHECDIVVSVATHYLPPGGSRVEAMEINYRNLKRLMADALEEQ